LSTGVQAQTPTPTPIPAAEAEDDGASTFDPAAVAEAMSTMMEQMEAMMAAAPDEEARQEVAPAVATMLSGMMGLNQTMMAQMQSMPGAERQAFARQSMPMMRRMAEMMGRMQPMMQGGVMGQAAPVTGAMPMTGTMPMGPMGGGAQMGMMGQMMQMMQMMGQMQSMMGPGMMDQTTTMTGTMPMGPMGSDAQMGQLMQMMGMMMQMMGQMHGSMGPGMMGEGMMGPGMMDGTRTMTDTMPMGAPGGAIAPEEASSSAMTPQTAEAAGVTVDVVPLTLGDEDAASLDFQVTLDTHTVELGQSLADIAVLRVGDVEIEPDEWEGPVGGHHVEGVLRFPASADGGQRYLTDAEEVSLVILGLADVEERVFTWMLEQ
jgi:hypothetical protein